MHARLEPAAAEHGHVGNAVLLSNLEQKEGGVVIGPQFRAVIPAEADNLALGEAQLIQRAIQGVEHLGEGDILDQLPNFDLAGGRRLAGFVGAPILVIGIEVTGKKLARFRHRLRAVGRIEGNLFAGEKQLEDAVVETEHSAESTAINRGQIARFSRLIEVSQEAGLNEGVATLFGKILLSGQGQKVGSVAKSGVRAHRNSPYVALFVRIALFCPAGNRLGVFQSRSEFWPCANSAGEAEAKIYYGINPSSICC